jgi:hypothetical protein
MNEGRILLDKRRIVVMRNAIYRASYTGTRRDACLRWRAKALDLVADLPADLRISAIVDAGFGVIADGVSA